MRILIVEDELLIAWEAEMALSDAGHDVVGTAPTVEKAVELAERHHPDVIIMDLRLKNGGSGVTAATMIRAKMDAEIIFASGNLDPDCRARLASFNPLAMISKPYKGDDLVQAIDGFLPA